MEEGLSGPQLYPSQPNEAPKGWRVWICVGLTKHADQRDRMHKLLKNGFSSKAWKKVTTCKRGLKAF